MGWAPALLGLFFTAFVPAAIQQGHFFVVDGFFTAIAPYAVLAVAWVVQSGECTAYIAAGVRRLGRWARCCWRAFLRVPTSGPGGLGAPAT